jgi:DNA-binding CsgD family transcriptional regulator/tetratricopeptide (TPR) repeat protein
VPCAFEMVTIAFVADGLVGRGDELALLAGLVGGLSAGVGGVVLIEGEQGIGKSSVLRAGLAGAGAAGCRVLWGAAEELAQLFPLQLMMECLGPAAEPGRTGGLLAGGGGGAMAGDPVLAGVERLLAVVDRLCAQSPVVLVAEDLQWADEASVLVWYRLCRAAGQMPLLLAGSWRSGTGGEGPRRLRRAVTSGGGSVVALGPLPDGQVAELVGGLVGGRPGQRLSEFVGGAGGNPLYAGELADGLVREGLVRLAAGVAELADHPARGPVPVSLTAVIGERLDGLAEDVVAALEWAAVLGTEFSVADLEVVSGRSAGDLMAVVKAALSAGVVAEAGPRLRFRHGLIRQVLYERMPAGLRAALHVGAARALADAGAGPARVAAQLAAVERAPGTGVEPWVVDWLAAAAPALTYLAPAVAADLIRDVSAQLPRADARREDLEASLVTAAFLLLRHDEVEQVGQRLLAAARDPDRVAEMTWLVGYTLLRTGRRAEATLAIRAALSRPGLSPAWTARLTALHALIQLHLGLPDEGVGVVDEALAVAERSGDRLAIGYSLHTMWLRSHIRRDMIGMLDLTGRGLAVIGGDSEATDLRLLFLANRANALADLDRRAEAIATAREAVVLAEQAGTPRLATARFALAEQYFCFGQWDDALAELDPAVGLPGPDYLPVLVHGLIAVIAAHRQDWQTAEDHLSGELDQQADGIAGEANGYYVLLARALLAERAGSYGEVIGILSMAIDPDVAQLMTNRFVLLPTLARAALELADEATLAAAAAAAQQEAERGQLLVKTAIADQCRGLMTGDPGPVLAAADYFGATGRLLDHGLALEDAAVLAARRDDPAVARRALAAAMAAYQALGADWDIHRASARLRPLGVRRRRPADSDRPLSGWGALTPTEVRVAGLVAAGRSNPDIAAELFLSRNTVQTHVSHILAKLDAQSRVEIVAEARARVVF